MNAIYQEIANLMVKLKPCVALTGAGLSGILEEIKRIVR
jgi:hypothetical protein